MKLPETLLWNLVYWVLYLAVGLFIPESNPDATLFGMLLIGVICSVALNIVLYFHDDVFSEYLRELFFPQKSRKKIHQEMPLAPALVQTEQALQETKTVLEVYEHVEKETPEVIEPEPRMRTDVDLHSIDADDDHQLSKRTNSDTTANEQ